MSTGLELRMMTSTRLKTCLYSFTTPGAPMYPTRAVRHAAWDALDFLFPVSDLSFTIQTIFQGSREHKSEMQFMAWKFK